MQKLLCHGNYCELVLSPVRASFKQPSADRPVTGPTNSVAHPSVRSGAAPPPNDVHSRNHPKSTPAHNSVAAAVSHKHHSIICVGAGLIQFVHGRTCGSAAKVIPKEFLFRPFFPASFPREREAVGMKLAGRVVFNIKVEATWIASRNDFIKIPMNSVGCFSKEVVT